MDVFVAGATGVVGRRAVSALLAAGHSVRAIARGPEKAELVRSLGAEPVEVGLFEPEPLKRTAAGADAVVNLATKIPPLMRMRSKKAWAENDRIRREGSRALVDAALAAGAKVYVQESITFIYADGGDRWLDEEAPVALAWVSLDSTLDAEAQANRFAESGGNGIALRFAAFYAPDAGSTLDSIRLARRRLLPVIGKGDNYISSVHAEDAAAAVVAALGAPSGVYNVCDDEPLPLRDYVRALTDAFGFPRPRRLPAWLGRLFLGGPAAYILRSQRVSNRRFKETTGWSPRYPSARDGYQAIAAEFAAQNTVGAQGGTRATQG